MSTVSDPLGREYPEMNISPHGIFRRKASDRLVPCPTTTGEHPNMVGRTGKRPIPEGSSDSSTDGRRPSAEEEIISIVSGEEDEIDDADASSSERYRVRMGVTVQEAATGRGCEIRRDIEDEIYDGERRFAQVRDLPLQTVPTDG